MAFGVGTVIAFFVGAIVGRYFEKIIGFVKFMRKDLQRVQRETSRGLQR